MVYAFLGFGVIVFISYTMATNPSHITNHWAHFLFPWLD